MTEAAGFPSSLGIRHSPLGVGVFFLLARIDRVLNEGRYPV